MFIRFFVNLFKYFLFQLTRYFNYLTDFKPQEKDFYISGHYEPVFDELEVEDISNVQGEIPKDISGSKNSTSNLSIH
jgi:carotenoid cleavage dioxygenase-like enzyme